MEPWAIKPALASHAAIGPIRRRLAVGSRRTSASRCVFGPRSVHSEDMTTDRGTRVHPVARPDRSGRLPLLLDIEGVADVLGVSVWHVRRLVAERRIPYIKWGRYLRFDPAQLEVWIDDARIATHRRGAGLRS